MKMSMALLDVETTQLLVYPRVVAGDVSLRKRIKQILDLLCQEYPEAGTMLGSIPYLNCWWQ